MITNRHTNMHGYTYAYMHGILDMQTYTYTGITGTYIHKNTATIYIHTDIQTQIYTHKDTNTPYNTHRYTDIRTYRRTYTHIGVQPYNTHTHGYTDIRTYRQTQYTLAYKYNIQIHTTDIQTGKQTYRQTHGHTDRHTDIHTDTRTNRQTNKHTEVQMHS